MRVGPLLPGSGAYRRLSQRTTTILAILGALVVTVAVLVACIAVLVESSLGPVDIGPVSLSGPRTWTVFHGKARVVIAAGGYKLWLREDPPTSRQFP